MRIFERFGFQMIVATPLKSVMTLEPFIGGACFVEIRERRHSTTLQIAYDRDSRRLALPQRGHRGLGPTAPASPSDPLPNGSSAPPTGDAPPPSPGVGREPPNGPHDDRPPAA
jgi:hypothetical protein